MAVEADAARQGEVTLRAGDAPFLATLGSLARATLGSPWSTPAGYAWARTHSLEELRDASEWLRPRLASLRKRDARRQSGRLTTPD